MVSSIHEMYLYAHEMKKDRIKLSTKYTVKCEPDGSTKAGMKRM